MGPTNIIYYLHTMTTPFELKYQTAVELCNTGDFKAALDQLENLFASDVNLLVDQAIRRTYVLSSWIILGKFSFPPALESLASVLKSKEKIIAQEEANPELVKDVDAIKFCLNNLNFHI